MNVFNASLLAVAFLVLAMPANAHGDHSIKVYVKGAELSYVEEGKGPTVILLHGGLGDYSAWQPQMMPLAQKFHVISYSRRYAFPNNNPPPRPDYSLLSDVDDLAEMIEKLGLKEVRLVGQSAGGFVALAYTLKHQEMVRALVLSEPPAHQIIRGTPEGKATYDDFFNTIWIPASKAFRESDIPSAMRIFVNGIAGANRFDSLPPPIRADLMRNSRSMEAQALSSDPFPAISAPSLKHLYVPTLVITGANTIKIHKLVNAELARLIPDAKVVTIPDAGHNSPRENIPAYTEALLSFLATTL
jgi:pimeloyl-ACP methyl ester carboxylesterase